MIGLIDPALLLPRPADQEADFQADLDRVIAICRSHSIAILPFEDYWPDLWLQLGRTLESGLSPSSKRSLHELRKLADSSRPRGVAAQVDVWRSGFDELFGPGTLPEGWELKMAKAAARAITADQKVVLLTRRMAGRNLVVHATGHVNLHEITRWVLYFQIEGVGRSIHCVHDARNISQEWTIRFDVRLPCVADGARFPFCPPDRWWKRAVESFRTVGGRPAWVDRLENGWSRPNIPNGAGYHWDVNIRTAALQESVGLDQINVVQFGCPSTEGHPGHLHHVPSAKAGNIRANAAWSCPA